MKRNKTKSKPLCNRLLSSYSTLGLIVFLDVENARQLFFDETFSGRDRVGPDSNRPSSPVEHDRVQWDPHLEGWPENAANYGNCATIASKYGSHCRATRNRNRRTDFETGQPTLKPANRRLKPPKPPTGLDRVLVDWIADPVRFNPIESTKCFVRNRTDLKRL